MPKSGGGGSHSGGSHSSSGSSYSSSSNGYSDNDNDSYSDSHSSDNYRPSYSKDYFLGATRYVYYDNRGKSHDYYGTKAVSQPSRSSLIKPIIIALAIGLLGLCFLVFSKQVPEKVTATPAPAAVVDETGIFTDSETARKTLQKFTDETGITTYIVAVRNEQWEPYYKNMEVYAYQYYVNLFKDEKGLLILYSEPTTKDPNFNDWYFEIMYGNDTVNLLTDSKIEALREGIQKELVKWDNQPEIAISTAVSNIGVGMMDTKTLIPSIVWGIINLLIAALIIFVTVRNYRKQELEASAVPVKKDARERVCEYCGTHYIVGITGNCRACGAPLQLTKEGPAEEAEDAAETKQD